MRLLTVLALSSLSARAIYSLTVYSLFDPPTFVNGDRCPSIPNPRSWHKHFDFGKAYMQMGYLQRLAVVMAVPCTYYKRLLTGSVFTQLWIGNQNCCC
jgi:hypothetical protein